MTAPRGRHVIATGMTTSIVYSTASFDLARYLPGPMAAGNEKGGSTVKNVGDHRL
jgi:methylglyoxal synthase